MKIHGDTHSCMNSGVKSKSVEYFDTLWLNSSQIKDCMEKLYVVEKLGKPERLRLVD